jgi:N-formylglutamate amidohydrolase
MKYRKEIVLGNNGDIHGQERPGMGPVTCPSENIFMIRDVFEEFRFSVSINHPYSGGYITTHYGAELADRGKIAVQIEINQDLYLDGVRMRIDIERLANISGRLQKVFREIGRRL